MIKHTSYSTVLLLLVFFTACKSSIKPDELYGKWKYIKVENPHANPPDSVTSDELNAQSPSIEFTKSGEYVINWGGKILSHGKFTPDGKNILIKESMPDGTTRQFPFWVSELTDKEIIFETKGEDGSRVKAVKE